MRLSLRRLARGGLLVLMAAPGAWAQGAGWLDRPMTRWNQPGAELPAPLAVAEARDAFVRRCKIPEVTTTRTTSAASAVAKAGWVPFLHFDREILRDEVEIIGGMSAATPSCDPGSFNLFLFVGGRFAGTLAPAVMTSRRDGAIGAVRITATDTVTAEFARYVSTDPDCCPSSHVRVTYRIDRSGPRPLLAAMEARQVR